MYSRKYSFTLSCTPSKTSKSLNAAGVTLRDAGYEQLTNMDIIISGYFMATPSTGPRPTANWSSSAFLDRMTESTRNAVIASNLLDTVSTWGKPASARRV